jgi:transposase
MGFEGTTPANTGRPSYHPAVLLKLYIYGYLNRVQSSRLLERECHRNVELIWSTGRLALWCSSETGSLARLARRP